MRSSMISSFADRFREALSFSEISTAEEKKLMKTQRKQKNKARKNGSKIRAGKECVSTKMEGLQTEAAVVNSGDDQACMDRRKLNAYVEHDNHTRKSRKSRSSTRAAEPKSRRGKALSGKFSGIQKSQPGSKIDIPPLVTKKVPLKPAHEPEEESRRAVKTTGTQTLLPLSKALGTGSNAIDIGTRKSTTMNHGEGAQTGGAFKEALTTYSQNLTDTIPALLESAHGDLKSQLSSAAAVSIAKLCELSTQTDSLFFPLGEVELEITLGKGTITQKKTFETLGARMMKLEKLYIDAKKRLTALNDQWMNVSQQIKDMYLKANPEPAEGTTYAVEFEKIHAKYEARKEKAKTAFERNLAKTMDKAVKSEKAIDDRRRESNKQLLMMIDREEADSE